LGEIRYAYTILVGKPERKKPLGRPRRIWEDNIKMKFREIELEGVFREIGLEGVFWIREAQYRNR
jgi:hypothetical protein